MHIWQPTAQFSTLQYRAHILSKIRQFFSERQVLEVETPLLATSSVTDPHLQSFSTHYYDATGQFMQTLYLQTSPEFCMKRLLAAGSGPIYQITRAFRNNGESGRWHNPEFTMLEWYRPGFTLTALMDEAEILLQTLLDCPAAQRFSYTEIFQQAFALNPHQASLSQLEQVATQYDMSQTATLMRREDWLQLLLDHIVRQPRYAQHPLFVYDFPAAQAALARIRSEDPPVAERVEIYLAGLELANGFHELADAQEQRQRFLADLAQRQDWGLALPPLDEKLLTALTRGLPDCSGIALGVDRLIALATQATALAEVISFPIDRV